MRKALLLFLIVTMPTLATAGIRIPSMLDLHLDPDTIATLSTDRQLIVVYPAYNRVVKKKGETKTVKTQFVSAAVLIPRPLAEVRTVIEDYDNYEKFLPQAEDVKILRKDGNRTLVRYELNFEFSIISVGVEYDLEIRKLPNGAYIWRLVKGDMDENYGSWEFIPVHGGKDTVAIYTAWSDLASMGFVVRQVLKAQPDLALAISVSTVSLVAKAIRKRILEVFPHRPAAAAAPVSPTTTP